MTMHWEIVNDVTVEDVSEYTERMRVPGGWIYRVSVYEQETCTSTALTFVPDAIIYVTLTSPSEVVEPEVAKVG